MNNPNVIYASFSVAGRDGHGLDATANFQDRWQSAAASLQRQAATLHAMAGTMLANAQSKNHSTLTASNDVRQNIDAFHNYVTALNCLDAILAEHR